jgi:hypothetical protein
VKEIEFSVQLMVGWWCHYRFLPFLYLLDVIKKKSTKGKREKFDLTGRTDFGKESTRNNEPIY